MHPLPVLILGAWAAAAVLTLSACGVYVDQRR